MKPSQLSALALALLVGNVTCGLGGCVIVKEGGSRSEWAATMPVPPPAVPPSSGAIYQSYNSVSLFNDLRARRVGDIITVRLSERTAASKSSSTNSSKTTDVSIASPTVLGTDVTYDGTQFLSGSMEADQSFSGAGDSAQSNSLTCFSPRTTRLPLDSTCITVTLMSPVRLLLWALSPAPEKLWSASMLPLRNWVPL